MNRLSLSQAGRELADIKASLEQAQHSLGTACEHRPDIESQSAVAQPQYHRQDQTAYAPPVTQQTYQRLNQADQGIAVSTGRINASLNSLHALGDRIQSAMREQEANRRQHDHDAQNLGSGAAQSVRGGLADVQKVIRSCQKMLGEINTLTQSAKHSLSLIPGSSGTRRGTIDTLVGPSAEKSPTQYITTLNETLYLMRKHPQYLVAPSSVPDLGASGTQRSGTIWDKVNYGGGNLKYQTVYKRHVDNSSDTSRMMNIGYNLQNSYGKYAVGKMHERPELDYGRHKPPY
ncbi:hypothetical protein ACFL6U_02890 [Planctomycetota bacterium]